MARPPASGSPKLTLGQRNVQDLARVIVTEAGGENQTAQTAVGWTLRNRMVRNGTNDVERVWRPAYQHRKNPTASALVLAKGILDGTVADPTSGATHFYTPQAMPKKGDPTAGIDVAGGLETVPGVTDADGNATDKSGKPIQNYAPSCARFPYKPVPGVAESVFKFYQQPGDGHVH